MHLVHLLHRLLAPFTLTGIWDPEAQATVGHSLGILVELACGEIGA